MNHSFNLKVWGVFCEIFQTFHYLVEVVAAGVGATIFAVGCEVALDFFVFDTEEGRAVVERVGEFEKRLLK